MCRPGGKFTYRYYNGAVTVIRPVPLKAVSVEANIRDFSASVTITQRFENVEENPIEATYQFPMSETASIVDFTCEIDGRKLKGTCQEKEEAKNTYDDAIAEGHGAYLLEQEVDKPEFFTVAVGNLPPGKEVLVHITYVTELEFYEKVLTWTLPSTREDLEDPYSPYYRGLSLSSKFEIPRMHLTAKLDMTSNIRKVSSSSHPITFEFGEEPNQATVALSNDYDIKQAKDFEISIVLAQPHNPTAHVQEDVEGRKLAAVSLFPDLTIDEDADVHTELIFIIDRSGSMSGTRINQVKNTMQIFLRSLAQGVMFQILGFGTDTDPLFKKKGKGKDMYKDFSTTVEYNDSSLEIATKHINTLKANLGGTEILKALQEVLSQPPQAGYSRQIFLLTDGEVNNTEECIEYVRQHANTTRVFTFGIGKEASPKLVKGIAKAGEGRYEFVGDTGGMEEKVLRQLNRAMRPALTELAVTWRGFPVHQTPHVLAPVFDGGRITFYGFVEKGGEAQGEAILSGKLENKPFSTSVPIDLNKITPGDLYVKLASRSMIRDLEEKRSYMHDAKGQLLTSPSELKDELVRLSTKSGVLCKHTAFVAVEERTEATEGTMESRNITTMIKKAGVVSHQRMYPYPSSIGGSVPFGSLPLTPPPLSLFLSSPSSSSSSSSFQVPVPCSKSRRGGGGGGAGGEGGIIMPDLCLEKEERQWKAPKRELLQPQQQQQLQKLKKSFALPKGECKEKEYEEEEEAKGLAPSMIEFDGLSLSSSLSSMAPPPPSPVLGGGGIPFQPPASPPPAASVAVSATIPPSNMTDIIMKQKATGSWTLANAQTALSKVSLEELKKAIPAVEGSVAAVELETLWATALVVAFLAAAFPDQKVNWELVAKKAKTFINRQSKKLGISVEWEDIANKFVSDHL